MRHKMEWWLTSNYHRPSSCPDRTAQLQKVHVHVVHDRFEEERNLNIEDLRVFSVIYFNLSSKKL
jgi:hypothetical protein